MVRGTGNENEIITTTLIPTKILEPRHKSPFELEIYIDVRLRRVNFSEFSFYPNTSNWFKDKKTLPGIFNTRHILKRMAATSLILLSN